ncbi:AAA family ATPase [Sinomonas sp. B1-1]|uniref:helix-turn-helix transcriptional regulator n=1 Tax=Sinomonas sp. B1-1 TaxID=3141454 RepID=UPI003D270D1D
MLNPHDGVVARAQELSELDALLGAAASAGPQCVIVEGPSGIGKTALVDAFAALHPDLPVRRAEGTPWERGLRGGVLAQLGVASPPGSGRLDEEGSGAEAWGPDGDQPAWLPAGRAAGEWLAGLTGAGGPTEGGPALVVLDGLEDADELSLEALAFALRRLRGPVLVLAACGPAGTRPASPAAQFAGAVRARRLRLGPLTHEALRELAFARAGVDLGPDAVQALWRATGGNPGLALEALADGVEALGAETLAAEGPRAVVRSVAERAEAALAGLPAPSRALVEAVSVLGGTPSAAAAAQLARLPEGDAEALLAAADAAWAAGLLECRTVAGSLQVTIRDPLVRDAVHAGLGPLRRSTLHARAAELSESTRDRVRHLVAAAAMPDGDLAAAVDALAEAEAAEGDWGAAADALVAAARLHVDPALREDRLVRAAEAMIGAGDLTRAAPLARQIESLPQGAERDAALAYHAIHTGQARRAGALLARAWETRPPTAPADLSARIAQYRVLDALGNWDGEAMLAWTETAVRIAGPDSTAGIEARAMLGLALGLMGRHEEARRAYDELSSSAHLAGRDQRLRLGRGWVALALDDMDTARLELRAAIPPARRPGSLRIALWAHAWLARAEFAVGRWDDALATARAGLALNDPVGISLVEPVLRLTAAQVCALRGQAAEAAEHSQQAQSGPEAYPVMRLSGAMAAAAVAESAGDYAAVLRALEPIVHMDRTPWVDEPGFWPWQDVYANALVMAGELDRADAFLAPLEAAARGVGHRSTTARLGSVRGRLLGAQGRLDEAVAVFEESLAAIEGLPLPWGAARVRFAYGQTLRRAGRRRDASGVLAAARDAFAVLGASVYVARCERELQAAGTGVFRSRAGSRAESEDAGAHAPVPAPAAFTAQEEAVARLVADGRSNREAARELFVSVKTVQYHLTRIYAKLGIGSRSELAAVYRGGAADEEAL